MVVKHRIEHVTRIDDWGGIHDLRAAVNAIGALRNAVSVPRADRAVHLHASACVRDYIHIRMVRGVTRMATSAPENVNLACAFVEFVPVRVELYCRLEDITWNQLSAGVQIRPE